MLPGMKILYKIVIWLKGTASTVGDAVTIEFPPNIVTILVFCVKLEEWDFQQG